MLFRCCSIWTNMDNSSKHFSGSTLYCHHQHRAQINCGKHLGRSQMTHKGWSRNSKPPGELSMQKQYIPSSLLSSLAHKTWGYNRLWETRHSGYASVQRAQAVHGINVLLPKSAVLFGMLSLCCLVWSVVDHMVLIVSLWLFTCCFRVTLLHATLCYFVMGELSLVHVVLFHQ